MLNFLITEKEFYAKLKTDMFLSNEAVLTTRQTFDDNKCKVINATVV